MLKTFNVNGKEYNIKIWTVGKEKEVLLGFGDYVKLPLENQIKKMSEMLAPEIKDLPPLKQLELLVKASTFANTDSKTLRYICPECGGAVEVEIDITNNLVYNESHNDFVLNGNKIKLNKDINKITVENKNTDGFLDSLSIQDYKLLEYECDNLIDSDLYLEAETACLLCGHKTSLVRDKEALFQNYIIGLDLENYYELLKYFVKNLNFSINDFNSLYPFELNILLKEKNEQ